MCLLRPHIQARLPGEGWASFSGCLLLAAEAVGALLRRQPAWKDPGWRAAGLYRAPGVHLAAQPSWEAPHLCFFACDVRSPAARLTRRSNYPRPGKHTFSIWQDTFVVRSGAAARGDSP